MRIRRNLVALLVLAIGLTGVFLVTLTDNAASSPRKDAPAVAPAVHDDADPGAMGYDGVVPGAMGYDGQP